MKILRFNKALLAMLALFVVILSATAVSAIDDAGDVIAADEETEGADTVDNTDTGDATDDGTDDATDDGTDDTTDYEDLNVGDNPYRHGEKTPNEKGIDEEAATANASGENNDNVKNAKVSAGSTATGNPLVALLAAVAIVGTGFIRSRK